MTRMKRIGLALGATGLAIALAGGVYASGQNTNDAQRPFSGRGPGGPGRGMAGGPGGMLGPIMMMARELDLSDTQKDQIKTIGESHREEWKALADRERAARQALNAAIAADTFDETLIRQRSSEAAAVDADLAVARARAHAEVFRVLTPEQQAKAKTMRESRRGRR